jgi:rSAM/selenodomain-associated transferase 1
MPSTHAILDPAAPAPHARRASCALALMTRAPRAGQSKTRLAPPLTQEEAAELSACFLRDTAANVAAACDATNHAAQGVAVFTPASAADAFVELLPPNFSLLPQRGADFGARLANAARDLFAVGFDSLCLINSDSPTLPTSALVAAVDELARAGDRVVLGIADDGGYYLIGLKSAHARLFEEIEWSTPRVAAQTIARAEELRLPVALLPAWYDADDAAALARLCEELLGSTRATDCDDNLEGYDAAHTRDFLVRLIAREGRTRIWRDDEKTDCAPVEDDAPRTSRAEATS